MTWKEIKRLNEERGEVLHQMKGLLDKAEAEHRDLSTSEAEKFDELNRKSESLIEKRERYEAIQNGEQRQADTPSGDGPLPGREDVNVPSGWGEQRSGDTWIDRRSGKEIRSFAGTEGSVAEYLMQEQRSAPYTAGQPDYRDLRPGQFLRAMVAGPQNEMERRALGEGTDSTGGFTVPRVLAGRFIDLLRARTSVLAAGAQTVPLSRDNLRIARLASDPVAAWRAENAAVAESDPTFDSVEFAPKSLAVLVKVSRELAEDSPNVEAMLERAFAGQMAVELDRAALLGSGTGNEPTGLVNITGVNAVAHGAALADYSPLIDAAQAVLEDNAGMPNTAIMAPRDAATFAKLTSTDGQPLMRPGFLDGVRFRQSTSIPTDGGAGTNESSIILGGFRNLLLGIRSDLRIEVLREKYAENLQFGFIAHLRADVAVEHAASFCKITGIIP